MPANSLTNEYLPTPGEHCKHQVSPRNGWCLQCVAKYLAAHVEPKADDVARWQFVKEQMNYSFDGQDHTYYLKAKGRETFEEAVDRRRDSSENRGAES